jgi:hypothetical protein
VDPPECERTLLEEWRRRAREAQWAHYECSKRLMWSHYLLGVPLVIFAAFAGTAVFATLSRSEIFGLKLGVGIVLVLTAILGGLQTFLRLSDRASQHRLAGAEYASVRRLIEERLTGLGYEGEDRVAKVRKEIDNLAGRSPEIPSATWRRVERKLRNTPDAS